MSRVFRMLSIAAAGVWLGAMISIAIVAQTTFATMRTIEGIERPNYVAGRVMARNFARFDRVQIVCASVLLVSHVGLIATGSMRRGDWVRAVLLLCALGLTGYGVFKMTPTIQNMQGSVAGVDDPEAEARRRFDAFHHTAVTLSKANLALVAAILFSAAWPCGTRRDKARLGEGADAASAPRGS